MRSQKAIGTVCLGLAFLVLYALFPSRMHFVDGVGYAWNIEHMDIAYEWHPHHLIWLPIMDILFHAFKAIIPGLRAMDFLIFMNSILGGISIMLLIQLVWKLSGNWTVGMLSGVLMGVSWGMMHYSSDVNIYMIEIVLLLLIAHILTVEGKLTTRGAVGATLLIVLASLIHQLAFFFTFAVLAGIIVKTPRGHKFKTAFGCTLLYAVIVVAVNLIVYSIAKPLVEVEMNKDFIGWLTTYGHFDIWWTMTVHGFSRTMGIFQMSQINLFFLTPDSYFHYNQSKFADPEGMSWWYTMFYFVIVASLLWEIIDLFHKPVRDTIWRARFFLLVWILPYFIFNHFYCAFEIHYKLFYLAPLLTLWSLRLAELKRRARIIAVFIVAIIATFLGIWNFATGMYPNSKPETNPSLDYVLQLKEIVRDGDLVIFSHREYYKAWLFKYYSDADAVIFKLQYGLFAEPREGFLDYDRQTVEYFNSRYDRIFLSEHAAETRPRNWYFSGFFFPPPHPDLMALFPGSIIRKEVVESKSGQRLHRVELKPSIRYVRNPDEILDIDIE